MRKHVIGGLAVVLAATAAQTNAQAMAFTVNCNNPAESISGRLEIGFDEITVVGTCTETVEIRRDDITIEGAGDDAVIAGKVLVDGAGRVTIKNLTIQGVSPDPGVLLKRGASAVLDNVTVDGAGDGVNAIGNAHLELINGSVVENSLVTGIFIYQGSSALIIDSAIHDNQGDGVAVQDGASVELRNNTFEGNGPEGDAHVFVSENSSARLVGNSIVAIEPATALTVVRGGVARLAGQNTLSGEGFATINLSLGATLIQRGGLDTVNGPVQIRNSSSAEFRSILLQGDVNIEDHSVATLHAGHISGSFALARDSGLSILGGTVDGGVECADEESSFFTDQDPPDIGGGVNCSGF